MVSPVNGDKPISPSTERSGGSSRNLRSEQAALAPGASAGPQASEPDNSTLEVDKARQLYEMESQKNRALDSTPDTPEAARSLLDKIVEQFNRSPEQALQSQTTANLAPLARLLEAAPA